MYNVALPKGTLGTGQTQEPRRYTKVRSRSGENSSSSVQMWPAAIHVLGGIVVVGVSVLDGP